VGFSDFGRRRDFGDSGDGEADRSAGPRRCRIPGVVADSGVGAARWATAIVRAVPAEFAARAPSVREGKGDWSFEGE
jgi:hypothetical protein